MTQMRRAMILKMAAAGHETGLSVMNGVLRQHEQGRWYVGERELDAWLQQHEGEEVVLVLGSMADDRPVATKTCGTCGRDFIDLECPHCRASRLRLRGRP